MHTCEALWQKDPRRSYPCQRRQTDGIDGNLIQATEVLGIIREHIGNTSLKVVTKVNQLEMLGVKNGLVLKCTGRFHWGTLPECIRRDKGESIGGKLRGVEDRKRSAPVPIPGVLERERRVNREKIFEEMPTEKFQELQKDIRLYTEVFVKCQTNQYQKSQNSGGKRSCRETREPSDLSRPHQRPSPSSGLWWGTWGQDGAAGRRYVVMQGCPWERMKPTAWHHERAPQRPVHMIWYFVFFLSTKDINKYVAWGLERRIKYMRGTGTSEEWDWRSWTQGEQTPTISSTWRKPSAAWWWWGGRWGRGGGGGALHELRSAQVCTPESH